MSDENRREGRSARREGRSPDARSEPVRGPKAGPDAEAGTLPKDDVFHILQTRRRRDAIRYLLDAEGPVEMRDLAEQVAAWENDTTVRQLTSDQRQRVYISLYQSHLPKLDAEGVVEYDQSRGVVRSTDRLSTLGAYLERGESESSGRDGTYHAGAIGVSATLLILVAAGPLAIPGLVLGAIIVGLFLVATTVSRFR